MYEPSTGEKMLWFVGLWVGGVLTVAIIAYAFKLLVKFAAL